MQITVRPEIFGEEKIIHDLTAAAFAPKAFSDGSEAALVGELRDEGDLTLSLVAVEGTKIVGHVAFSPLTIGAQTMGWYGLGPVSVWPDTQRNGIGSALVRDGLARLNALGANGCALTGDPAFYGRFGFANDGTLTYRDTPNRNVLAISFNGRPASGELRFSSAFER